MSERLIAVFAVGKDRPGLLAEVTDTLMKVAVYHDDPKTNLLPGGNTSLLITLRTDASVERVRSALEKVDRSGDLYVHAVELTEHTTEPRESEEQAARYVLRIRTTGRPGVLAAFTSVVARHDGSVIDFGTRIGGGRISVLRVELPEGSDPIELARDLYHLDEQIGVGIKFYDATQGEDAPLTRA